MIRRTLLAAFIGLIFFSGCGQDDGELQNKLAELENRLAQLERSSSAATSKKLQCDSIVVGDVKITTAGVTVGTGSEQTAMRSKGVFVIGQERKLWLLPSTLRIDDGKDQPLVGLFADPKRKDMGLSLFADDGRSNLELRAGETGASIVLDRAATSSLPETTRSMRLTVNESREGNAASILLLDGKEIGWATSLLSDGSVIADEPSTTAVEDAEAEKQALEIALGRLSERDYVYLRQALEGLDAGRRLDSTEIDALERLRVPSVQRRLDAHLQKLGAERGGSGILEPRKPRQFPDLGFPRD